MSTYSIGIDLGTTNSAVSYFKLADATARGQAQTMLAIPQVTAVGTVGEKLLLPSFLYLPNAAEFPAGGSLDSGHEPVARDFVPGLRLAPGLQHERSAKSGLGAELADAAVRRRRRSDRVL